MKLIELRYTKLEPYHDLEIEDVGFFFAMIFRMIEDTEIVIYSIAKAKGKDTIDEEAVSEAISLITSGSRSIPSIEGTITFEEAPTEASLMNPHIVRDFARAPLPHQEEALALLSKYLNFQLNNMLIVAARQAHQDNLPKIKLRHYLLYCEEWPWPLNRYC